MAIGLALFYLTLELNRYCSFCSTRDRLWASQTPLSENFNRGDWFVFVMERLLRDRSSFQRIIEHLFWNVPYQQIDKCSLKRGLFTIASGGEHHDEFENKEFFKSIVERVVDIITDSESDAVSASTPPTMSALMPFARINNTTTNHTPSAPLFRIFPFRLGWLMFRTFGQHWLLSKYSSHKLEHGLVMYRRTNDGPLPRQSPRQSPRQRPRHKLLFIHGIGIGVFSYLSFIDRICSRTDDVEIVLLELPGVSGANTDIESFPTAQQIVETVVGAFEEDDIVDGIGHSYGSLVLSYITNQRPYFLRKRIFIDTPVFFPDNTKFWPSVFRPITWSALFWLLSTGRFARALSDFIFSEQWSQQLIHNSTYFYEFCNREIGLDENTMILLGERDRFISPFEIKRYFERYHPSVLVRVFDKYRHGDAICAKTADMVSEYVNGC